MNPERLSALRARLSQIGAGQGPAGQAAAGATVQGPSGQPGQPASPLATRIDQSFGPHGLTRGWSVMAPNQVAATADKLVEGAANDSQFSDWLRGQAVQPNSSPEAILRGAMEMLKTTNGYKVLRQHHQDQVESYSKPNSPGAWAPSIYTGPDRDLDKILYDSLKAQLWDTILAARSAAGA